MTEPAEFGKRGDAIVKKGWTTSTVWLQDRLFLTRGHGFPGRRDGLGLTMLFSSSRVSCLVISPEFNRIGAAWPALLACIDSTLSYGCPS